MLQPQKLQGVLCVSFPSMSTSTCSNSSRSSLTSTRFFSLFISVCMSPRSPKTRPSSHPFREVCPSLFSLYVFSRFSEFALRSAASRILVILLANCCSLRIFLSSTLQSIEEIGDSEFSKVLRESSL